MKNFNELCSCCKKPLITIHCKQDYTISTLAVGIIVTVLLTHLTVCKISRMAAVHRAVKKVRDDARAVAQSE